jgi:hypothetical protein
MSIISSIFCEKLEIIKNMIIFSIIIKGKLVNKDREIRIDAKTGNNDS